MQFGTESSKSKVQRRRIQAELLPKKTHDCLFEPENPLFPQEEPIGRAQDGGQCFLVSAFEVEHQVQDVDDSKETGMGKCGSIAENILDQVQCFPGFSGT